MNIIGKKNLFAFAYELDEQPCDEWMFGKCCFFINGVEVGDYELGTSLRDVYIQMPPIVKDMRNRQGGNLCNLEAEKAFLQLKKLLYDDEDQEHNDLKLNVDLFMLARFNVTIPVDVFDEWHIYAHDCGDSSRILFKNLRTGVFDSLTLPKTCFDDVWTGAFEELDSIYEISNPTNCST